MGKMDEKVFEKTYHEYKDFIYNIARRRVKFTDEADDVVQLTFIELWKTDCTVSKVRGWLSTVATQKCFELKRQRYGQVKDKKIYVSESAIGATICDDDNPEFKMIEREENNTLNIKVEKILRYTGEMSEQQKLIFQLKYIEGWSIKNIAKGTGSTQKRTSETLFRALTKLRRHIL
jgi:RNA polymerase sigma factor (sigma-70 family)